VLIRAQVPLSELTDYATELKGATAGRGRYDLEFSHYEPVPGAVQKQLMEAYKPRHDEE
jgi:elongation factor G